MKVFPDPTLINIDNHSVDHLNNEDNYGMDLRDYFAAKAMQGELSASTQSRPNTGELSEFAYEVADEMMEARK